MLQEKIVPYSKIKKWITLQAIISKHKIESEPYSKTENKHLYICTEAATPRRPLKKAVPKS